MSEELFNLRNAVYIGNYQQAISEALTAGTAVDLTERDFFMYKAYTELGQYRVVLDEVNADSPVSVQAIRLLAAYLDGSRETKDVVVLQLKEWLSSPQTAGSWHVLLVAGTIYMHEDDHKEALRLMHQNTQLDVMALVVHIYLAMYRPDLARKQVAAMQEQDDDATLTKLAGAWVSLSEEGDKHQDALYEFQELGEKYTMTTMLLNALALCNLHMGKFEEAERVLNEALSKNANDATTLANLIVCLQQLRKSPDVVARYVSQLKAVAPTHPWCLRYTALEESFVPR